jgi:hypothetical protein
MLDAVLQRLDLQTLKITAEVLHTPQLQRWLSSFGPDIEIPSPLVFRELMATRHQQAAELYK